MEQSDRKIVWEVPYEDVTNIELCKALKTLMIGMSFSDKTVNDGFAAYLSEFASDIFEINEKDKIE